MQKSFLLAMVSKRIRITGRVQGVGYRAWTMSQASQYNIAGWVRNRSDGSVEAQLQGSEELIKAMIKDCYDGPLMAHVSNIEISDSSPESLSGFDYRATY
jgi:acylphosphatase